MNEKLLSAFSRAAYDNMQYSEIYSGSYFFIVTKGLSMRVINKISYSCAKYLTIQLNQSHQKKSVYYYGFQVVYGAILKGILLFLISILLGVLKPAIIIMLTFGGIRIFAGGHHMKTYNKCVVVSLAMFISCALITEYTYRYWSNINILSLICITFVLGLFVLIKWAPKDNPNRIIKDEKEKKKFKMISMLIFLILMFLSFSLFLFKIDGYALYVLAICLGLLQAFFIISPVGCRFYEWLEG